MLNRFQGILFCITFSIVVITVAAIVQAVPQPVSTDSKDNPMSNTAHDPNTVWKNQGQADGQSNAQSARRTSVWSGPYSSGHVVVNPDGSTTTTWSGPYSSGQVVVSPGGSTTTTWSGPYSNGQVVTPR